MVTERCDGYLDCSDSSDERNCTGKQQPSPISQALLCVSTQRCSPGYVTFHSQHPRCICLPLVVQATSLLIYNQLGQTSRPDSTLDNLSSGSLKHRKNNFRMGRSKAVYFTWATGEAIVSSSVTLCKVTLGAMAHALLPSLVLPCWSLVAQQREAGRTHAAARPGQITAINRCLWPAMRFLPNCLWVCASIRF